MKKDGKMPFSFLQKKHMRLSISLPDSDGVQYENIKYSIDSWSSFFGNFHPNNITKDISISDQFSKWSVDFKSKNEYIILKLDKTSIVQLITFGKYNDPTSLKEFKLYSGMTKDNMTEILHSNLRNENEYETLSINYKWKNKPIPSNYIKLVPLKPYNIKFNISVWFINLRGITDEKIVQNCLNDYNELTELEDKKLWLKLTRELPIQNIDMKEINDFISKFEPQNMTNLYNFIMKGEYDKVVQVISEFKKEKMILNKNEDNQNENNYQLLYKREDYFYKEINNLFEALKNDIKISYLLAPSEETSKQEEPNEDLDSELDEMQECLDYSANNRQNNTHNHSNGNNQISNNLNMDIDDIFLDRHDVMEANLEKESNSMEMLKAEEYMYPCPRGGHSMVLDKINDIIYIYGGWTGDRELGDLWSFDIKKSEWNLITKSSEDQGGPGPISCHKMVFDHTHSLIYIFGRHTTNYQDAINSNNRLYTYSTESNKWNSVLVNVQKKNGILIPLNGIGIVFDHQMVLDEKTSILYIFGGVSITSTGKSYLGLWKLDLVNGYWENLLNEEAKELYGLSLKTRCGHTMIFMENRNQLLIMGGGKYKQKVSNPIYDILLYEIDTGTLKEISHDYTKMTNSPFSHFSLGVCYNSKKEHLYIFGGSQKGDKESLSNNFHIFDLKTFSFSKLNNNKEKKHDSIINYDLMNLSGNRNKTIFDENIFSNRESNYDSFNEPVQRYAHCMVYSENLNKGFIFGGNPNIKTSNALKVNDFWSFTINEKNQDEVEKHILLQIYLSYYEELCMLNLFEKAVQVLNENIYCLLDSKISENELERLSEMIVYYDYRNYDKTNVENEIKDKRKKLYSKILNFIKTDT